MIINKITVNAIISGNGYRIIGKVCGNYYRSIQNINTCGKFTIREWRKLPYWDDELEIVMIPENEQFSKIEWEEDGHSFNESTWDINRN